MTILTKKEAARLLRVSPITVDRLRGAGKLTSRKIGSRVYFTQEDIQSFIDSSIDTAQKPLDK